MIMPPANTASQKELLDWYSEDKFVFKQVDHKVIIKHFKLNIQQTIGTKRLKPNDEMDSGF